MHITAPVDASKAKIMRIKAALATDPAETQMRAADPSKEAEQIGFFRTSDPKFGTWDLTIPQRAILNEVIHSIDEQWIDKVLVPLVAEDQPLPDKEDCPQNQELSPDSQESPESQNIPEKEQGKGEKKGKRGKKRKAGVGAGSTPPPPKKRLKRNHPSLRLIDWFVTNYAKSRGLAIRGKGIYKLYKASLDQYRCWNFDPFRRNLKLSFQVSPEGPVYYTTVGQLNFLLWADTTGILDYVKQHRDAIDQDMSTKCRDIRKHREEVKKTGKRRKRSPLSNNKGVLIHLSVQEEV